MPEYLGIDTSNYTTSAALFRDGKILQKKKLLPVRPGELGLRQSDAVFHHTQQLPELIEALLREAGRFSISGIGVSSRPRDQEDSYMPCFTVGMGAARTLSAALGVPYFSFSHQAGHIAAALFSAGRMAWLEERQPFLAFHVSGGTTEAVRVFPGENGTLTIQLAAQSLDLKAGQAVDRVGGMLGLSFPAGRQLEKLALNSKASFSIRPSMKGADCSLSGVQNQCETMIRQEKSREDVALFCLLSIEAALSAMTEALLKESPSMPVLYAGGVMGNSILQGRLREKFHGFFAAPEFSSDNAAGIAILAGQASQE